MATQVSITRKLGATAQTAWDAVSRIGRLDVWFPGIETCRVDGEGVGARRLMTLQGGGEITDVIMAIDPGRRRLTYHRIASPFPVSAYVGTVEVFESFDGRAVVAWTVDFVSAPEVSVATAKALEAGIGAGVAGMDADLPCEGGAHAD